MGEGGDWGSSWNSFTRLHSTINYSSEDIQGATAVCFLFVRKTSTVALTVVYFRAWKSGLTSPGKFTPPPSAWPLVSPPHTAELCAEKRPPCSPAFRKLEQGPAEETLESLFIIYLWSLASSLK